MTSNAWARTCTVIVCTRNRHEELNRCLEALARMSCADFEVLVVDNAPCDARAKAVAARWGARYVVEPIGGLSRARNTGARSSVADIVAFTDDDAVPDPEWLSSLLEEFRHPEVDVVTGAILPFTGAPGGWEPPTGQGRIALSRDNPLWFEMAYFGGIGNGGNMAFRRLLFDEWPGFDERLGRGSFLSDGEEHHAFAELIERGHCCVHTPRAIVRHGVPQALPDQRRRYLRSVSDLAGLMAWLVLTSSGRWKVLRYAAGAFLGVPRTWRIPATPSPARASTPRWRIAVVCLAGVGRCLLVCLQTAGQRARRRAVPVESDGNDSQATVGHSSPDPQVTRWWVL